MKEMIRDYEICKKAKNERYKPYKELQLLSILLQP